MNSKNKVAIIGSGPAGYIAAINLVKENFDVTVFDALNEFGGMLAYGVPEYKIPLETVREKISTAKKQGIKFVKEKVVSVKNIIRKNGGEYDYVLLCIGFGSGATLDILGKEKKGVFDAIDFLTQKKLFGRELISKKDFVAVIGGGNSAMSAAIVTQKTGAKTTVVYRRTEKEMPAFRDEIKKAKECGVEFEFLKGPISFNGKESVESITFEEYSLGEKDSSGRAAPVKNGKTITLNFSKVLLAVGQSPDFSWLEKEGIILNKRAIKVDENYKTSIDNIYAAGDCVTGPKNIGEATRTGLGAARAIISNSKVD